MVGVGVLVGWMVRRPLMEDLLVIRLLGALEL
jgi:hypothetical protein